RVGASSLITAGIAILLCSYMVRKCCRRSADGTCVEVNWHDLFKNTHLGRTVSAAMTAVFTWRACDIYRGMEDGDGPMRVVIVFGTAAFISVLAAGALHTLHFRVSTV
ncbi:unnamed protein product, partial [Choristocarpus tenellus]